MAKGKTKILLLFFLIPAVLVAGAAFYGYRILKGDAVAHEGDIYLPGGSDYTALTDSLSSGEGYIRDMAKFRKVAKLVGLDKGVSPGHYCLEEGMDYTAVARMFRHGLQAPVRVTFNNIRLLPQFAGRVAGQIEPDSLSIAQALLADTTAARYGFTPQTFIAMFIPDTYEMYWTVSPRGFVDQMKREYDRFWNGKRDEKREKLGMSRVEVATLASIVYEETKMADEMPAVAGVYVNRLRKGWKLEADPTVKFAVGDFSLRRVLYSHLETDSPYNTYKYGGIPPGPICMPSITAVDAVLNYREHDYMFFCAKPDFSGYHSFAITNAQHERNRQAWVAALNRAGIR